MKGLMELLAKSDSEKPKTDAGLPPDSDGDADDISSDGSFEESAAQAMEAVKSGDSEGFAEALRACIEMSAA